MSNTRKVIIGGQEKELNERDALKEETFKVDLKPGRPLLSGIINQPITIKEEYTGAKITGSSADDIIAALSKKPGK